MVNIILKLLTLLLNYYWDCAADNKEILNKMVLFLINLKVDKQSTLNYYKLSKST